MYHGMEKNRSIFINGVSPYVSIVIPIYKVEKYIRRCAYSIFEQSLKNMEFIFVDDCSPDCSIQILEEVIKQYPQRKEQVVIVRNSCNMGIAAVRNLGLKYAKGKYIGWVDGDDWIDPEMYEELYYTAVAANSDIVWCDFYNSYKGDERLHRQQCNENNIDFIKSLLLGILHGGLCFTLIKRDLFLKNHIHFPEGINVMEDKNVLIKLSCLSERINYLPIAYYHYIQYNSTSITNQWNINPEVEKAAQRNLEDIFSFLVHSGLETELWKDINYAKLIFKRAHLNSVNIGAFRKWKTLFEESNRFVWSCPNLTVKQKVLGWSVAHDYWFIVKLWFVFKNKIMLWRKI